MTTKIVPYDDEEDDHEDRTQEQPDLMNAFIRLYDAMETERKANNAADAAIEILHEQTGTEELLPLMEEFFNHPITQDTMNRRVVSAMLKFNTGRQMMDSGFYGRAWEKNAGLVFDQLPEADIQISVQRGGGVGLEFSRSVYHWLVANFDFEPGWSALLHQVCAPKNDDWNWLELAHEFPEWLKGQGFEINTDENYGSDNSYNGENNLTQVMNYTIFQVERVPESFEGRLHEGVYFIINIHGGADVRGGYAAPVVFSGTDSYDSFMPDFDSGSLYCNHCHSAWDIEGGSGKFTAVEGYPETNPLHMDLESYRGVEDAPWEIPVRLELPVLHIIWVLAFFILNLRKYPRQTLKHLRQYPKMARQYAEDYYGRNNDWRKPRRTLRFIPFYITITTLVFTAEKKKYILDHWAAWLMRYSKLLSGIETLLFGRFEFAVNAPYHLRNLLYRAINRLWIYDFWRRYIVHSWLRVKMFWLQWSLDVAWNKLPQRNLKRGSRYHRVNHRRNTLNDRIKTVKELLRVSTNNRDERKSECFYKYGNRGEFSYHYNPETNAWATEIPICGATQNVYFAESDREPKSGDYYVNLSGGLVTVKLSINSPKNRRTDEDVMGMIVYYNDQKTRMDKSLKFINPLQSWLRVRINQYANIRYWFVIDNETDPLCPVCREGTLKGGL
jgi:hypothetical protein